MTNRKNPHSLTLLAQCLFIFTCACANKEQKKDANLALGFGDKKVQQIETGTETTCLLLQNGKVTCKGTEVGQAKIPWYRTFTQIAVSQKAICGLREGNVLGFGKGEIVCYSQNNEPATPPKAPAGNGHTQITAGEEHFCAVRAGDLSSSDKLICWGPQQCNKKETGGCWYDKASEAVNMKGDGNTLTLTVKKVVTADAAGDVTCYIKKNGAAVCFGHDAFREKSSSKIVREVPLEGPYQHIAIGLSHACAIRTNSSLDCWGHASEKINDSKSYLLTGVPEGKFVQATLGWNYSCAQKKNKTWSCWGATVPANEMKDLFGGNGNLQSFQTEQAVDLMSVSTTDAFCVGKHEKNKTRVWCKQTFSFMEWKF